MFADINERLKRREWTEDENKILREYYPVEGTKVVDRIEGRTKEAIKTQANKLGLRINSNLWTEEEIEILRKYYPIEGMKVKNRLKDRTRYAISTMASDLKLKKINNYTKENDEIIKKYYPIESSTQVEIRTNGLTAKQICNRARKLGIKKEKNYNIDKLKSIMSTESNLENVAKKMGFGIRTLKTLIKQYGLTWDKREKLSKYKYVTYNEERKKYVVLMRIGKKQKNFGYFENEDEAGKVAIQKAKEYGKAI